MKRWLSLALCLILVLSCAAAGAESFSASSAYEARKKALDLFDVCALTAEYPGADSYEGYMKRWEESIHIYLSGNPGRADRQFFEQFLIELAIRVPTMPNITITANPSDANIQMYFGPLNTLSQYVPNYVEGNWGMFYYYFNNYRINRANIGIATDVTDQRARNHLMMEELVGALGLPNDHYAYSDSILYQPWTTVQELSDVDWIMLNMLYSPLVSPGMEQKEIRRIFLSAWQK